MWRIEYVRVHTVQFVSTGSEMLLLHIKLLSSQSLVLNHVPIKSEPSTKVQIHDAFDSTHNTV